MSVPERVSATAKVQLTLEIDCSGGNWGPDCTTEQVYKQAKESALNRLQIMAQRESSHGAGIRIIGQPKVSMITFTE